MGKHVFFVSKQILFLRKKNCFGLKQVCFGGKNNLQGQEQLFSNSKHDLLNCKQIVRGEVAG